MSTGWQWPPELWLVGTAICWGCSGFILLAGSGWQSVSRSLDWDHCWGKLWGQTPRGQCTGLGHLVLGITWGQGLWHLPQPKRSPRGKGLHWGQREAGTRARDLGWPKRSPRGKAYVEGKREAGTQVYRSWKEARSRMTKESKGKGLHWGHWEAGTQCIDVGMDIVVRGTLDELPPDGNS